MKKSKKKKLSTVKKKLWKLVSEYVRRSNSNLDGNCYCVTCGKADSWKRMDAGHFIGGHKNYNYYDLRNIHPQCTYCNRFMHGNLVPYYEFMERTYGKAVIEELKTYKEKIFSVEELEMMIDVFKQKLKEIPYGDD